MHICTILSLLQHQAWNYIIKLQLLCNRSSFINHIANILTSKENKHKNINVTSFMRVVLFLFSIQSSPASGHWWNRDFGPASKKFGDRWFIKYYCPFQDNVTRTFANRCCNSTFFTKKNQCSWAGPKYDYANDHSQDWHTSDKQRFFGDVQALQGLYQCIRRNERPPHNA